jgi:hypothetical protein
MVIFALQRIGSRNQMNARQIRRRVEFETEMERAKPLHPRRSKYLPFKKSLLDCRTEMRICELLSCKIKAIL